MTRVDHGGTVGQPLRKNHCPMPPPDGLRGHVHGTSALGREGGEGSTPKADAGRRSLNFGVTHQTQMQTRGGDTKSLKY